MSSGGRSRCGSGIGLMLMVAMLSGCMAQAEVVGSDKGSTPAESRPLATVPTALHGVWYVDDAEGQAACRAYLSIDPATVDRTGADPLVGAVVVTRRLIHRYSEYGEGNFFRVDQVKDSSGAWALRGQMFFDSIPSEGELGVQHSERLELAENGRSFSLSEAAGVSYFKCGEVRSDLYSAQ